MIDMTSTKQQRTFTFNASFDEQESKTLSEIAVAIGCKRLYVVLFAVDVLGEELQDNPSIADDIESEYKLRVSCRSGKRDISHDLKSQLTVPASWFDPAKIMSERGVPQIFTYRFASLALLNAIESIDDTARGYLLSQIKSFCEQFSEFSRSKVKSRHFLLSKMARHTEAPAHRGFIAYNPEQFKRQSH